MGSKRDNGTGTIYQRTNGTWVGKIYIGRKPDGRSSFKYLSGKSESDVKRKIREYNKLGHTAEINKISLGAYLMSWLRTYKRGVVKQSSYDAIERTIINHIQPDIGSIQLQQLTGDDIQRFLMRLKDVGHYSYSTIKKAHDCLNSALKHALINGDINKNPMDLVKMPSSSLFEKREIKIFTEKECALITEEATRTYSTGSPVYIYGDAFMLILNTGIRLGEAIGLKKSDWDRENSTLHIQRNTQSVTRRNSDGTRVQGKILISNSTKTYSGDRVIPLNQNAIKAIMRLCDSHPDSEYVICSSNGSQVPPERLDRTFCRLLKNAGLDQTGVHSLRHTFASLLFAKKTDIKTVSMLLGHAGTQITINTYVHLIGDVERLSVSKLDNIL